MLLQRKPEVHIENYNFNWRSLTDAERCWIRMWSSPLPPTRLRSNFLWWQAGRDLGVNESLTASVSNGRVVWGCWQNAAREQVLNLDQVGRTKRVRFDDE
jgi:hypothetical protein